MAKIVQMYSYKGGSGRTVGTANIAAILASEFKQSIVCIDLDIESAGMSMVLGLYNKFKESTDQKYIQDILSSRGFKSNEDFKKRWPHLHINIGKHWNDDRIANRFLFMPAQAAFKMENADLQFAEEEANALDSLLKKIKLFIKPDFILIDSASGLTDPATIGMDLANIICIFFRWNNQFVTGTIDMMEEVIKKKLGIGNDNPLKYVILIPSAVPDVKTKDMDYSNYLSAATNRIKTALSLHKNENIMLTPGVPETVGLKWEEKVLLHSTILLQDEKAAYEAYKEIANGLINLTL